MHGNGTMVWKTKKKYVGQFQKDKRHGYGVISWPNGQRYEGLWQNGKKHGTGKYIKDGQVKYGEWVNDENRRWMSEEEYNISKVSLLFN